MCIIVVKHEGNTLAKETLEICFYNNADGAGFMWYDQDKGKVVGDKGYMTFERLWTSLTEKGWVDDQERISAERGLVLHCRVGTHGTTIPALTHPFPITTEDSALRSLNWEAEWGLAHNGVITGIVDYQNKKNESDTMVFIKDYLADEKVLSMLDHGPCVRLMMLGLRTGNKFAFLTPEGGLILIGNFIKGQDGNVYSNSSFQTKVSKVYYSSFGHTGYGGTYSGNWTPAKRLLPSDGKVLVSCTSKETTSCAACPHYEYRSTAIDHYAHWCTKLRYYIKKR